MQGRNYQRAIVMFNASILHPIERCQLCKQRKNKFTCNVCVLTGNFCLSDLDEQQNSEKNSFSFKHKRLHVLRNVTNEYRKRLESKLEEQNQNNEKLNYSILLRNKVETLQLILSQETKNKAEEQDEIECLSREIVQDRGLASKTQNIKSSSSLQDKKLKLQRHKDQLSKKLEKLKQLRMFHIQLLVRDIFPISERIVYPVFGTPPRATISTHSEPFSDVISESFSTSAESELEEATRTVHVEGKWVSLDSEEKEFTIIDSGMPTSGDFLKYFSWLKSYRCEPRSTESSLILHHNEIMRIPAALFYSAQLNKCLAYFLDVNLPHRIDMLNFGMLQVSRKKLVRTINQLIDNVMHTCFTQLVNTGQLEASAIIRNLKMCVESKHLGRVGAFETSDFKGIECPLDFDSSAEELNYDSEESDNFADGMEHGEEWDSLKDIPSDHRELEIDSPSPSFDQSSLSSSATGLVTSAAASISSALWSWKR